ncbi:MAG: photosystem II reaction center PsbP [Cyanobacteria bacterium J06642_2]
MTLFKQLPFKRFCLGLMAIALIYLGGCSKAAGLRPYNDINGRYTFSYPNGMVPTDAPIKNGLQVLLRDLVYGDENVSLMVSPYDGVNRIEDLGSIEDVSQRVATKILAPPQSNRSATLVNGGLLEEGNHTYYVMEFDTRVGQMPRHDVVTVTIDRHRLYTLTASTSDVRWAEVKDTFYEVAKSLRVS